MKQKLSISYLLILFTAILVISNSAAADVNTPISADQAFDAYANQVDPISGEPAAVAIVDVRTKAEYFWLGTPAMVTSIVTQSGKELLPHNGKVNMRFGGRYLKFKVQRGKRLRRVFLSVNRVESIDTEPISYHVPYKVWDEDGGSLIANRDFAGQMNALAKNEKNGTGYDVVILMCRSGKRSNTRAFATEKFSAVYEVDNGADGRGGFEGTSYNGVYNGFRGYPGRNTRYQESESVSWADAGLPIHIGDNPDRVVPVKDDYVRPR